MQVRHSLRGYWISPSAPFATGHEKKTWEVGLGTVLTIFSPIHPCELELPRLAGYANDQSCRGRRMNLVQNASIRLRFQIVGTGTHVWHMSCRVRASFLSDTLAVPDCHVDVLGYLWMLGSVWCSKLI
ncbi:hypothetical protein VFPPC_18245 [Pochonia chlamydosporia 170]|uniref:Uncharacterized protein n=1 Tax=Pochonia chlamydosporia 170 TaxID=1380566 RepID=A0A219ARX1_METCM|nr:hypothetical protein VFPPC_18245 [Pochonia chlamydosporia 170]OWT43034.1 hypothetical protein VFPPC_18245 [Pochonia chlamydosporia 170]